MKKPCKVVMLPTEKATILHKRRENNTLVLVPIGESPNTGQHLYITSDEEIKEGDYAYYPSMNQVLKFDKDEIYEKDKQFKVIATTDEWLGTNNGMKGANVMFNKFPQIPESFIKAYVEAQGDIKEVLVEYVIGQGQENGETTSIKEWIKTREDNTIIIHRAKTYTREEMEKAYREGFKDGLNKIHRAFEWIQDNL